MRVTIGASEIPGIWIAKDDDGNIVLGSDSDQSISSFKQDVIQLAMSDNTYGITEVQMSDQAEIAHMMEHPTAKPVDRTIAGWTTQSVLHHNFDSWVTGRVPVSFKIVPVQ